MTPPVAPKITVPLPHREFDVPPGEVGSGLIVAMTGVLGVLSHEPLLMVAKYVVVALMPGVVKALFTAPAMAVPPVSPVYHRYCPFVPPEAETVVLPAVHKVELVVVGGFIVGLSVTTKAVLVLSQVPLLMET